MSDTSNQIDPRSHKYIGKRWKGIAGDYIDGITPYISNCAQRRTNSRAYKLEKGVRNK